MAEAVACQGAAPWAWDWHPASAIVEPAAVVTSAGNLAPGFARPPIVPLPG